MTTIKLSDPCSRCPREQERVVTLDEAINISKAKANGKPEPKALEIVIDGKTLATYEKLCDSCREIVLTYSMSAGRKLEKKSSKRNVAPKVKEKPVVPAVKR